jgi:predicted MFS family arabinose efflux permease
MPLERATALHASTEHAAYVFGAPVGGVLVAAFGSANALWVDAASFGLSALVVAAALPAVAARPRGGRYVGDLVDGLRFIVREPVLRAFLAAATVGNLLISPLGPVFLPIYAKEEFGSAAVAGVMIAAYGTGGIAGTSFVGIAAERVRRRLVYRISWLMYPLFWAVLALLPPRPVLLPVCCS